MAPEQYMPPVVIATAESGAVHPLQRSRNKKAHSVRRCGKRLHSRCRSDIRNLKPVRSDRYGMSHRVWAQTRSTAY